MADFRSAPRRRWPRASKFLSLAFLSLSLAPVPVLADGGQVTGGQITGGQVTGGDGAILPDDPARPVETIIVVGHRSEPDFAMTGVEPVLEGRLSTLEDVFRGTPGVILEPVFGGVDHPRFSIRGSGLQRGTQPAGRGIDLRLDGVPMTYADTSFDFVEWIDPLMYDRVSVLRGGRGVLDGAGALGGVVNFTGRAGGGDPSVTARGEIGSFDYRRGQVAASGGNDVRVFATGTWFEQDGFREHNAQEVWRAYGGLDTDVTDTLSLRATVLWSDSELELPGPQTLAQIDAGSRAAQPRNVAGDWRRFAERTRVTTGLTFADDGTALDVDVGYMATDVEFRRRDAQVEENEDWSLVSTLRRDVAWPSGQGSAGLGVIYQHNSRDQRQFLNGGGTPPTFTGARGALWADNDLTASRLTLQSTAEIPVGAAGRLDLAAAWNRHTREIEDRFATRPERPAAELDRTYDGFTGLALMSWDTADGITLFGGISHVMEAPTYDILLINVAGTPGPGGALVTGADPRRPRVLDIDDQTATTVEAGARGRIGAVDFDITLYRAWLDGEIVSTSDFVNQVVTSAGNADNTTRWGVEAAANALLAGDILSAGDALSLAVDWTWTDARFDDDPIFGDNRLPILAPHVIEGRLGYVAANGLSATLFTTIVPQGGYADYANSLRADGYATLGGRLSWQRGGIILFVEGRNLTDERFPSSVISARNNLAGMDAAAFAPGEGAAVTFGVQAAF